MNEDAGKQKVIIYTHHYIITGNLNIYQGVRLTDYMNESKSFISVTDVEVNHQSGENLMKAAFLNVRKNDIEIIVPEKSLMTSKS